MLLPRYWRKTTEGAHPSYFLLDGIGGLQPTMAVVLILKEATGGMIECVIESEAAERGFEPMSASQWFAAGQMPDPDYESQLEEEDR